MPYTCRTALGALHAQHFSIHCLHQRQQNDGMTPKTVPTVLTCMQCCRAFVQQSICAACPYLHLKSLQTLAARKNRCCKYTPKLHSMGCPARSPKPLGTPERGRLEQAGSLVSCCCARNQVKDHPKAAKEQVTLKQEISES